MTKLSTLAAAAIVTVAMITTANAAMVSPSTTAPATDVAGKTAVQKVHWRRFCHEHFSRWDWERCYGGGGDIGYIPDCFLDWDGYIVCSGDWGYNRSLARRAARAGRGRGASARRSSRRRALRNRGGTRQYRNRNRGGERRIRNRRRERN